jgi:hypothetical protein
MSISKLLVAASVLSFVALPALAQTSSGEGKGGSHHYSGGPKSEVPHHIGPKKGKAAKKTGPSGSHHYSGGPREPHHIGPK